MSRVRSSKSSRSSAPKSLVEQVLDLVYGSGTYESLDQCRETISDLTEISPGGVQHTLTERATSNR